MTPGNDERWSRAKKVSDGFYCPAEKEKANEVMNPSRLLPNKSLAREETIIVRTHAQKKRTVKERLGSFLLTLLSCSVVRRRAYVRKGNPR